MNTTNEKNQMNLREIFVSYLGFMSTLAMNGRLHGEFKNNPANYLTQNVGLKFPSKNYYLKLDPVRLRWSQIWIFFKESQKIYIDQKYYTVKTMVYDESIRLRCNAKAWENAKVVTHKPKKKIVIHPEPHGQFDMFRMSDLQEHKSINREFLEIKEEGKVPGEFLPDAEKNKEHYFAKQIPIREEKEKDDTPAEIVHDIPIENIEDCFIYIIFPYLDVDYDNLEKYQIEDETEIVLSPCS